MPQAVPPIAAIAPTAIEGWATDGQCLISANARSLRTHIERSRAMPSPAPQSDLRISCRHRGPGGRTLAGLASRSVAASRPPLSAHLFERQMKVDARQLVLPFDFAREQRSRIRYGETASQASVSAPRVGRASTDGILLVCRDLQVARLWAAPFNPHHVWHEIERPTAGGSRPQISARSWRPIAVRSRALRHQCRWAARIPRPTWRLVARRISSYFRSAREKRGRIHDRDAIDQPGARRARLEPRTKSRIPPEAAASPPFWRGADWPL